MINAELLTHDLCTHGFHIVENFLEMNDYQTLRKLAETLHQNDQFKSAKIGRQLQAQQNDTIRTDDIFWLDNDADKPAVQAYFKQADAIASILNQLLFLGLVEFETHFAVYQPGAFYKKHVDQFATTKTRTISCVYYLNEHWDETFGGALKLYNKEDQLIQEIFPQGNRFICFNSELPHEVCLTQQLRYSIAGWMKTRAISGLPQI